MFEVNLNQKKRNTISGNIQDKNNRNPVVEYSIDIILRAPQVEGKVSFYGKMLFNEQPTSNSDVANLLKSEPMLSKLKKLIKSDHLVYKFLNNPEAFEADGAGYDHGFFVSKEIDCPDEERLILEFNVLNYDQWEYMYQ